MEDLSTHLERDREAIKARGPRAFDESARGIVAGLRFSCLREAIRASDHQGCSPDDMLATAERYAIFVLGESAEAPPSSRIVVGDLRVTVAKNRVLLGAEGGPPIAVIECGNGEASADFASRISTAIFWAVRESSRERRGGDAGAARSPASLGMSVS